MDAAFGHYNRYFTYFFTYLLTENEMPLLAHFTKLPFVLTLVS